MIIDAVQAVAIHDIFDIKSCNIIWYQRYQRVPQKSHGWSLTDYKFVRIRRKKGGKQEPPPILERTEKKDSWEKERRRGERV